MEPPSAPDDSESSATTQHIALGVIGALFLLAVTSLVRCRIGRRVWKSPRNWFIQSPPVSTSAAEVVVELSSPTRADERGSASMIQYKFLVTGPRNPPEDFKLQVWAVPVDMLSQLSDEFAVLAMHGECQLGQSGYAWLNHDASDLDVSVELKGCAIVPERATLSLRDSGKGNERCRRATSLHRVHICEDPRSVQLKCEVHIRRPTYARFSSTQRRIFHGTFTLDVGSPLS
jgi:hypothetical protein